MLISFCIPTYNRKEFVGELLESINNQFKTKLDIEICISDNASTDGIESIIELWRQEYKFPIVYHRNSVNLGPDRNFLSAVSLASGDYCWILGSDDALQENALATLEAHLYSKADIYLCDRQETGYSLSDVRNPHRSWLSLSNQLFILNSDSERTRYFKKCLSIGGVFSYLSSLIVKREKWCEVDFDSSYIGTSYPHVFIMMSIFNECGCRLHYISEPLVLCRGDNDSFEHAGKASRVMIDFVGYFKLANDLYHNSNVLKKEFERILLRERPWIYTSLKVACYGNEKDKAELATHYKEFGYNELFTCFIFLFGRSAHFIKNVSFLKKFSKNHVLNK